MAMVSYTSPAHSAQALYQEHRHFGAEDANDVGSN